VEPAPEHDPVAEEPAPEEDPVAEEPAPEEDPVAEEPAPEEDPVAEAPAPEEDPVSEPVDGLVTLRWLRPVERENGDYLEMDDVGGYELRYKRTTDTSYQVEIINDAWADSYELDLEGDYQFEIATFDTDGLYSQFVALTPY
jgi:hypothetical protein